MSDYMEEIDEAIKDWGKEGGKNAIYIVAELLKNHYSEKFDWEMTNKCLNLKATTPDEVRDDILIKYYNSKNKKIIMETIGDRIELLSMAENIVGLCMNVNEIADLVGKYARGEERDPSTELSIAFDSMGKILDMIPQSGCLSYIFSLGSNILDISSNMVKNYINRYKELEEALEESNEGSISDTNTSLLRNFYNSIKEIENSGKVELAEIVQYILQEYGWVFELCGISDEEKDKIDKLIRDCDSFINCYNKVYEFIDDIEKYDIDQNGIIVNSEIEMEKDGWNKSETSQKFDPLILDLNKNNKFTSATENGTYFDFAGDGLAEKTAWLDNGDGLLVLDRNGNGLVDDGKELFGDKTILEDGSVSPYGFAALSELDTNKDGVINSSDEEFDNLRVWIDDNNDGISQQGELHTLNELDIVEIGVDYIKTNITEDTGNYISRKSKVTFADGSQTTMGEYHNKY